MDTLVWICQSLLAALFPFSGIMKSTQTKEWLVANNQTGVANLPNGLVKFIGVTEILGSVGLILPWWLGIWPLLTPVAAAGFALIMILAAPIHYRRKEMGNVAINITVLAMCLFVAWYRWEQL